MAGQQTDVAIVGAGLAGLATAYYLCAEQNIRDLVLLDPLVPMSLTSAQSGENYRNWWPHPVMTGFTDRSIDLLEVIARETENRIRMTRRGYALATRRRDSDSLIAELRAGYGGGAETSIRIIEPGGPGYRPDDPERESDWQTAPDGVDVILDPAIIRRHFSQFAPDIATVVHVRRAGDISGQQLGQVMLETIRARGGRLLQGHVREIASGSGFTLEVEHEGAVTPLRAERLVDAAGPFACEIAARLGVTLPIKTVFQQKIAFEDRAAAVPRGAPFSVDLDALPLDWSPEERALLEEDPQTAGLAGELPGGCHCRPEGGPGGRWIKLGWATNRTPGPPQWEPACDPQFPELVLRRAAALIPALKGYYDRLPAQRHLYGGYYTMTEENWPLIGPMGPDGAFLVTALSGFGTMAACAAGQLCAAWVAGAPLPDDARQLSPARYEDRALMAQLTRLERTGSL